ncbi:hypothetical protein TRFO_22987 [Tritrichomonas foetus]|uniref:Uncharacterized protein n=1 Tax=Tritrichomonas foetus TaxID=1144522 RepID=A0A1J4KGN0_9EUKA|nr:hypothetical protein TRFO_22987 [Tritrichomonas foetus]|eukprot:OHT08477.1 hypothetical protein TRFO_22987 [Tritrichomonas foetus]
MHSVLGSQHPYPSAQSPIFVTARPNSSPFSDVFRTPKNNKSVKSLKSMRTLQTENKSIIKKKARSAFNIRKMSDQIEIENRALNDEYIEINREIALLECELMPLREKCNKLRLSIMSFNSLYQNDEIMIEPPNFNSAFIQLQNEKDELTRQHDEALQYYSNQSIERIQKEIEKGINFCELLSSSNANLKMQSDDIFSKITQFKRSSFFYEVQQQKKRIEELSQNYTDAKQLHAALKVEYFQLTDPAIKTEEKNVNEASDVIKLTRKLNTLKRKYYELCDDLIRMKQRQTEEVEAITAVLAQQSDTDLSES